MMRMKERLRPEGQKNETFSFMTTWEEECSGGLPKKKEGLQRNREQDLHGGSGQNRPLRNDPARNLHEEQYEATSLCGG